MATSALPVKYPNITDYLVPLEDSDFRFNRDIYMPFYRNEQRKSGKPLSQKQLETWHKKFMKPFSPKVLAAAQNAIDFVNGPILTPEFPPNQVERSKRAEEVRDRIILSNKSKLVAFENEDSDGI